MSNFVAAENLGDEEFTWSPARPGMAGRGRSSLFQLVAQPLGGAFRAQGSLDPDGLANEAAVA